MEQQTKTIRELVANWFQAMDNDTFQHYALKYEHLIGEDRQVTAAIKEVIYLSENPQTETIKEVDLTDASRLNDNTLYKFFRDENAALKQRIKELEREVIGLRKNKETYY